MMSALLATVLVAVAGHFTVMALVRHLDPHKALRAYWLALAAGSLVLAGTGCGGLGFGGPSKARPNRPGWAEMEHSTYDPVTGKRTWGYLKGQGAENADEPMTGNVDEAGTGFNSGTSAPFKWSAVSGSPVALFGCILFVAGIALMVVGKFPIAGFVIPGGAGWTCILGGAGLIALPFVAEALKPVITIGAVIVGIGFAIYYGHKAKWFEKATDTDAVFTRLAKGDVGGAAAMAFLHNKGTEVARLKAMAVKNGGAGIVTAAPAPPTPPA